MACLVYNVLSQLEPPHAAPTRRLRRLQLSTTLESHSDACLLRLEFQSDFEQILKCTPINDECVPKYVPKEKW